MFLSPKCIYEVLFYQILKEVTFKKKKMAQIKPITSEKTDTFE